MTRSTSEKSFHGILLLFLLITSLISTAAAQSFKFPTTGRFILPPSIGKKLLDQCSRPVPTVINEFWQPSAKEIDELEVSLAKYLEQREKAGKRNPPTDATYHRQYVGFVRNGERFIYGNFYPDYELHGGIAESESKQPVGVCDGGYAFWGIVYRVSTKTFEDLEFNGRA